MSSQAAVLPSLLSRSWNEVSWGRSERMAAVPEASPNFQSLIEISQPIDWTPGFNVTIIPPEDLSTQEYMRVLLDYGGGGVPNVSRTLDFTRPRTFAVPGKYVRVRACLVTSLAPIGTVRQMAAFATPFPRDVFYPYNQATRLTSLALAPGASVTIDIIGRSVRSFIYSAHTLLGDPCILEVQFGAPGAGALYRGPRAPFIYEPMRVPDNAVNIGLFNVDAVNCDAISYQLIEEF